MLTLQTHLNPGLERIPKEIWLECFSHVGFFEHKNIVQTCHHFYRLCLHLVFKEVACSLSLPGPLSAADLTDHVNHLLDTFEALAYSEEHAPLVRELSVLYCGRFPGWQKAKALVEKFDNILHPRLVSRFVDLLPRFENLRVLRVDHGRNLNTEVLNTIAGMSNLDILDFTYVSFAANNLSKGIRMKPHKLKINNPWASLLENYDATESTGVLDLFSGEYLGHLTVLSTTYCPEILRSLTDQSNCTRLRFLCLDIHVKDSSVLIPFLVSCPELETIDLTLRIPPSDSYGVPLPDTVSSYLQLPSSALGKLRSISGPAEMVAAFSPGRPIQDVTIRCERGHRGLYEVRRSPLRPALASLSQSTLPIKRLVIEADASERNLVNIITCHLPDLSLLQLHLQNRQVPKQRRSDFIRLIQAANEMSDNSESTDFYIDLMWEISRDIKYMRIIHDIVLQKIHLPANLEVLNIKNHPFSCFENAQHLAKDIPMLGWYDFSAGRNIMGFVSQLYPSLREITLMSGDEPGSEAFLWYKIPGGKWFLRQADRRLSYIKIV